MKKLIISAMMAVTGMVTLGDGLTNMMDGYVKSGRIAGVISVLSDNDYNVRYDCVGLADRGETTGKTRPMTKDTLFAIYSMTKTFTGTALMCAIAEGKISLDDPVSKYLPEFANPVIKDGRKPSRAVTIRDVTSHVSGYCGGYVLQNRDIPIREAARRMGLQKLEYEPGSRFTYTTTTFDVAAACLEVATGMPYEEYLRIKVLEPLGMKDTTFTPNEEQISRLVKPYTSDDKPLRPAADGCVKQLIFPKAKKLYPAAGGGLFSTAQDMIRFSQMLAHHGTWKGKVIIPREIFDKVFAVKQTPANIKNPYTVGSWIYGDWFGHEGAMRTDQRANLKTGHSRVFFIQTENKAGSAFFQLKKDWHVECDKIQGTPATVFGN